ncbi:MAG: hypothetical protein JSW25_01660 [Thermoplasmata archaeon]|nr:MAG: hypothetical protein JSW25_01660 [Thermoplasmata archaeon]
MKKLYEGKVKAMDMGVTHHNALLESIRHIGEGDTSACRAFLLERHDVKVWIIGGKLERVLESHLVSHDIKITKRKQSAYDFEYLMEEGLSLHAYRYPPEKLNEHTDKFVLSLRLDGIDYHNINKAKAIFEGLQGIPI